MGSLHRQRNSCQNIHLVRKNEDDEGEERKVGGVREEGDEKEGGRRGKEERREGVRGGEGKGSGGEEVKSDFKAHGSM